MPSRLTTLIAAILLAASLQCFAQTRKIAVLGSSTSAGFGSTVVDSSWVGRLNFFYKYQQHAVDTVYNLAASGSNPYHAMPTGYVPPPNRAFPEPTRNVSRAVSLLNDLPVPANGVVIVNFPTNGYETFTAEEVMTILQTIYDSATRTGNRCFVTTTQPRSDGSFASPASRRRLADLKDSIIARFGDNTIDFWDGLFNPADSSILPVYSAGDNIHLNNTGHNLIFNRVVGRLYDLAYTPAAGDYRSNAPAGGSWQNAANWKRYDGSDWVSAITPPSNTDGVITIRTGDSIRLNNTLAIDQVVVSTGAVLVLSSNSATNYILSDGAGHDILNNGRLYISDNASLLGNGTIQNNAGGELYLQNNGLVQVNITNDGETNVRAMATLQGNTFINNKTMVLESQMLNLNGTLLVNNDSISLNSTVNGGFGGNTAAYFVNNPKAVVHKLSNNGVAMFMSTVSFSNSGNLKGAGEYMINNSSSNIGTIRPAGAAVLKMNSAFISGRTPLIHLDIISTGATPGTNHSQLLIPSGNTSLSSAKLIVTNTANDAIGTIYTLISSPAGVLSGNFASVQLPTGFGNLTYTPNAITIQKIALIPLAISWGDVNVSQSGGDALLRWTTLQENNTAHFDIEFSENGQVFSSVGRVAAAGISHSQQAYSFRHLLPPGVAIVYYRLKQVDTDGQYRYSVVRELRITRITEFKLLGNPVANEVCIWAPEAAILQITDVNGKMVQQSTLAAGRNVISSANWVAGIYFGKIRAGDKVVVLRVMKM